jgi:phosphomevalonate kinase
MLVTSAPGKLILCGEYAVMHHSPALVIAVDRRAIAHLAPEPVEQPPLLAAVTREVARRNGEHSARAQAARRVVVDSAAFHDGDQKLGVGSSAAVAVAATACALGTWGTPRVTHEIAEAAHADFQGTRGSRGSGADIAAAVHGGCFAFQIGAPIAPVVWPEALQLMPFFTGISAETAPLVARVMADPTTALSAALAAITRAATALIKGPTIAGFEAASVAFDQLAAASGVDLVPPCVVAARAAMRRFGGTAKTTGAGGGDIGVAVLPATADATEARRALIEAGCRPLQLAIDPRGVDTREAPQ